MRYGHFDNEKREYVIDRIDVPVSWTNYLGSQDLCAVVNHTAGGYLFYKSPEYGRVTRFRPNGVPMDRPGHYVYIRDDESGEYWSISWQPVGGPTEGYSCRHGLGYSRYGCRRNGIEAEQLLFIPRDENIELWDVSLKNTSGRERKLSIYSYAEFSFGQIPIDNQNFQMSLYCAGSSYSDGIIDYELFYEHKHRFMASSFTPDGYECTRDGFIGSYRDERNPIAVEEGLCRCGEGKCGNHAAVLMKRLSLAEGEDARLVFMLGIGGKDEGERARAKYSDPKAVDAAFETLAAFWDQKLSQLQISTPDDDMDTMINIWNLYQSEINVMFSRFASFIEVGGRTGLGYRDTAQDAMTIPHSNPEGCKKRIVQLMNGLTTAGYGLHLFDPAWFEETEKPRFRSPTVIPTPERESIIHGLADVCADDALWLVASVVEYIKETGETGFAYEVLPYANKGEEGTVYEHLTRILDFSLREVGEHGICKGFRADWNDCLNLGGGESAMVSFLLVWALNHFIDLARHLGRSDDVEKYSRARERTIETCNRVLWDGEWYIRGITSDGRAIGTKSDREGRVHLESNVWAVISGVADEKRGRAAMDAVDRALYTKYGLRLNAPSYTKVDDGIGFITRVYPGVKENGSIFSHPNPWAWVAESVLGRGERAKKFYDALSPARQNDEIEVRLSEPYSYCQFIMGPDHKLFGKANHPFMTGSAGWSYYAASRYMLGIRPDFDHLVVDPCIPKEWKSFSVVRKWRGAEYRIHVENPDGVEKGVKEIHLASQVCDNIPVCPAGSVNEVTVIMG